MVINNLETKVILLFSFFRIYYMTVEGKAIGAQIKHAPLI